MTRESECSETPANGSEAEGLTPSPASFDGADRPPRGERLPKKTRILRGNEFGVVFKHGRRSTTPALRLVLMPNERAYSRLGLAVSRGVSKRAVVRNRVKRHLREIFRRNRDRIPSGLDIVAIPQPPVLTLDFDALRSMFLELVELYSKRVEKYGHGDPANERRHRGPRKKKGKRRGKGGGGAGGPAKGDPKPQQRPPRTRGGGEGAGGNPRKSRGGAPKPAVLDSTTPSSGAPNPGTPNSGTPNSAAPNPGTPNPGTPNSGTPDPGTPNSARPDSTTRDRAASRPATPDLEQPANEAASATTRDSAEGENRARE